MKIRGRLLVVLSIFGIFTCMVLPGMNAETFDIGTKVAESDPDVSGNQWYYFDSGCMIKTKPDYIDYVPLILDGNESTGIDYNFGPTHDKMLLYLVFPYSLNVTNITLKPAYHGNASEYIGQSLLIYINSLETWYDLPYAEDKIIYINGTINTIRLYLDSNGTNHFYFNDMIINYTPSFSNIDEIRDQINYLTAQINLLNIRINELNNTINELNLTQDILENVTNLLATYNQLNESFTNLIDEIGNLDSRVFQLESENVALKFEVTNLTMEIENLTQEIEKLKDDQDEPDDSVVFGAYILGILGIILALVAIILISKKSGSRQTPTKKEEPRDLITPEKNGK